MPKQVLVPHESADPALYERWLTEQRGTPVSIKVPQRGGKRELLQMVTQNAKEELNRHRLRRAAPEGSSACSRHGR